jgi:alkanesulfonate monooxygenase SsuD/methylene tetrahydromethanopterin reductase-like flavin-dependent oxidoreductase (luciferase family)
MSSGVSVDEFQALEQRVLRAVEIVKREREARAAAEAEVKKLREQLEAQNVIAKGQIEAVADQIEALQQDNATAQTLIGTMTQERDAIRERVERLLKQMDELL